MEYKVNISGEKRKVTEVICDNCSNIFLKRYDLVRDINFCNRKCYAEWRTQDKTKCCKKCGIQFEYSRREQIFCSGLCASKRTKEDRYGNGKLRVENIHNRLKKVGWDGNCMIQGCDYCITLDNHRIKSGKEGGLYTLDNICVVCPNHHAEIHRLKYYLERIDNFEFILVG